MCEQCEKDAKESAIRTIARYCRWNEASQSFIIKADDLYGSEVGRTMLKILKENV